MPDSASKPPGRTRLESCGASETQWAGEDIGDQYLGLHGGHLLWQVEREAFIGDAVAPGVVAGGLEGLHVDIGTDGLARTEQQCGDGEDAEPQPKSRTSRPCSPGRPAIPGTARWSGGYRCRRPGPVEQQVDRFGLWCGMPAWHDPQALAEAHWLEVVHPATFPVLILDHLGVVLRRLGAGQQAQVGKHRVGLGIGFEQGQQVGVRPQWGGVEVRFEDGWSSASMKVTETAPTSSRASS